jgi:hypothetical protein
MWQEMTLLASWAETVLLLSSVVTESTSVLATRALHRIVGNLYQTLGRGVSVSNLHDFQAAADFLGDISMAIKARAVDPFYGSKIPTFPRSKSLLAPIPLQKSWRQRLR